MSGSMASWSLKDSAVCTSCTIASLLLQEGLGEPHDLLGAAAGLARILVQQEEGRRKRRGQGTGGLLTEEDWGLVRAVEEFLVSPRPVEGGREETSLSCSGGGRCSRPR